MEAPVRMLLTALLLSLCPSVLSANAPVILLPGKYLLRYTSA